MKQVQTIEDVYPAIEELITELNSADRSNLAAIIDHRMHRVAWTARSELFEELRGVLTKALESQRTTLPEALKDQVQRVLKTINGYLTNPPG
jgi:uncharacterized protein YjgD (DUF1641 family)